MKFTQKTILVFFAFLVFSFANSQNKFGVPKDVIFYMEINGNQLNQKINWEKFNPILEEIAQKKNDKSTWNDYAKTGIKYAAKQYHYVVYNDSVKSYNAFFEIDNNEKFQNFVNSSKKEGMEITKKRKYSYVDLDNDVFVAWNGHHALLSFIHYDKPWKKRALETEMDSATVAVDSTAVATTDTIAADAAEDYSKEEPFNYKEEIEYLKENIKELKENIKENQDEIARTQKDIKYLQKHHKYPEYKTKPEEEMPEETTPEEDVPPPPPIAENDEDNNYQKEMDSMRIEKYKTIKNIAELAFDTYFQTSGELETPPGMTDFRDEKADVFAYAMFNKLNDLNKIYGSLSKLHFGNYFQKIYDYNSYYNLYFEKDQVKIKNNFRHNNPQMQKDFLEVLKGNPNKKLSGLINDKNIGYYAMNINGYKYFDLLYDAISAENNTDVSNEINMMVETMKIVLDEKEISKIAPGNGIFVLNDFRKKKVDYTEYQYDDDYNEKEVKKTKEISVPDFTFAFATENEAYWQKLFDMLASNKKTGKQFLKKADYYLIESETKNFPDKIFFQVKDHIVYITTSLDNVLISKPKGENKKLAKEIQKHSVSGRFDMQRLLLAFEDEMKSSKDKEIYNTIKKNIGIVTYQSDVKENSIETQMFYKINNPDSENSLMYFLDLFDEIYKLNHPSEAKPKNF